MAENDVTHAGHPWSATRWCVDDVCNRRALARMVRPERDDDPLDVFANCYRAMVEGGVPRHVAAKALLALVAAWATGTFTPGGTPR